MVWNWQKPDWPEFTGKRERFVAAERTTRESPLSDARGTQADLAQGFNLSPSTTSRAAQTAGASFVAASLRSIDPETERAVRLFLKRFEARYPVVDTILYGSRARGDHRPDSDTDLAVILGGARGDRYEASGEMAGIAFDVLMETGIMVQGLPLWEDELKQPERFSNPALIANIKREGLRL